MIEKLETLMAALKAAVESVTGRAPVTGSEQGAEVPLEDSNSTIELEKQAAEKMLKDIGSAVEGINYSLHMLSTYVGHSDPQTEAACQFRAEQNLLLGTATLKRAEWFVAHTNHYCRHTWTFYNAT